MPNLNNLVRKNIAKLKAYSSARDEFTGKEGLFLDANENPFGTLNRYPDPYQRTLKAKLSTLKNIEEERIFIGNGSDEVIDLAFRIFCEPQQDKALSFSPTYGMYDVSAAINDVELTKLPLKDNFQIDKNTLSPYFKDENLKIIFICSPNNPTGNCFKQEDILFILDNFQGITIIDEAYIDFAERESFLKLTWKYPRLIVSQTFSKAWGLASIRVGVAYANPEIIKLYNKVKPPYNVSQLNQKEAIKAIDNYGEIEKNISIIVQEKEKLKIALNKLPMVLKIFPSDANFLLVKFKNANALYLRLVEQKIILRNRHSLVDNCIRISIGTPEENKLLIKKLLSFK